MAAGKRAKNDGYIVLTEQEANVVRANKVVETFWFHDPRGWWDGPDGHGIHPVLGVEVPYLHYPGIRDAMIDAGVAEEYLPSGDWIMAEYVHESQMPRCTPIAINGFIDLFFGAHYTLFGHQLGMYYSPQRYNLIVGGRGSGKTVPIGIVMVIWTALHPGEPWLHVALSLDQAKKAYNAILDLIGRRHYKSDGTMTDRTFSDVFIQDRREFPQPDIYFKAWDEHDGGEIAGKKQRGNIIMFRPLGDEDLERLRSTEAGNASGDEILREIAEETTIRHVRGCLRGLNPWLLAHLAPEKRKQISQLQQLLGVFNVRNDAKGIADVDDQLRNIGVDRMKRFYGIGNAGEPEWVWEVMDLAEDDIRYAWFIQVTMYNNIRLTPDDRAALEEAWGTDPETRQVELLGRRPLGTGNEIDPELLMSAVRELGGQVIQHHNAYGILHYAKTPVPGHYHVISGDPGKDRVPRRNSWCVIVLDITANPAEIVYFQMGNVGTRSKTYKPYTDAYKKVVQTYPVVSPVDILYDNGGMASGMHEVTLESLRDKSRDEYTFEEEAIADGDDIYRYGNPQNMTNVQKYAASNWLIDMLRKKQIVMPELRILIRQTSNWTLPDKDIPQDSVMTLFMIVSRVYWILSDRTRGYADNEGYPETMQESGYASWGYPGDMEVLHDGQF